MNYTYVATCLLGLEALVRDELRDMGAENIVPQNGRVFFEGNLNILIRANLWSRYSERILINMGEFEATTFDELFENTKAIAWEQFIRKDDIFPVNGSSLKSGLFSVRDCQSIIKKAIVERLKLKYKVSWFNETGITFKVRFLILKDKVSLMIDTSGNSLHKRGYRVNSVTAPIRETLAAAMVNLARVRGDSFLIDPFCGSGTILIEGAMKALNMAPGLLREFACGDFWFIDKAIWKDERERAKSLLNINAAFSAAGYDIDEKALKLTKENAENAGVRNKILVKKQDIKNFTIPQDKGIIICNPPYGERILDIEKAKEIYKVMGNVFIRKPELSYSVISPEEDFEMYFKRKADKKRKLYNGMIKCQVYMYFK
jgi:putative N6-adenine-specific DNA methylase